MPRCAGNIWPGILALVATTLLMGLPPEPQRGSFTLGAWASDVPPIGPGNCIPCDECYPCPDEMWSPGPDTGPDDWDERTSSGGAGCAGVDVPAYQEPEPVYEAGDRHSRHPNVYWTGDAWRPLDGCRWLSRDIDDLSVGCLPSGAKWASADTYDASYYSAPRAGCRWQNRQVGDTTIWCLRDHARWASNDPFDTDTVTLPDGCHWMTSDLADSRTVCLYGDERWASNDLTDTRTIDLPAGCKWKVPDLSDPSRWCLKENSRWASQAPYDFETIRPRDGCRWSSPNIVDTDITCLKEHFRWISDALDDPRSERIPGSPHPQYVDVVWGDNAWRPARGMRWIVPGRGTRRDFRVESIPPSLSGTQPPFPGALTDAQKAAWPERAKQFLNDFWSGVTGIRKPLTEAQKAAWRGQTAPWLDEASRPFDRIHGDDLADWVLFDWPTYVEDVPSDVFERWLGTRWLYIPTRSARMIERLLLDGERIPNLEDLGIGWSRTRAEGLGISNLRPGDLLQDVDVLTRLSAGIGAAEPAPDDIRELARKAIGDDDLFRELLTSDARFSLFVLGQTAQVIRERFAANGAPDVPFLYIRVAIEKNKGTETEVSEVIEELRYWNRRIRDADAQPEALILNKTYEFTVDPPSEEEFQEFAAQFQ